MNILVINCHWDNRGDEAAIRAMIDELLLRFPEAQIQVQRAIGSFGYFPTSSNISVIPTFPLRRSSLPKDAVSLVTNGRICLTSSARAFYDRLKKADIVIHAPGGPSIGDIYLAQEIVKLIRLLAIQRSGKPYVFYAPSMGPFKKKLRNIFRKKVLKNASLICLREAESQKMVEELIPGIETHVTLDSAFQHDIDIKRNEILLKEDNQLNSFIGDGSKVVGVTVTDLQWNKLYSDDGYTENNIRVSFTRFIKYLICSGYKVLFIPQLFGGSSDSKYMESFVIENCYVVSDSYDCYFQQYIISRLMAVVGMRYHSNIFSAKMGTPFISISYEQKMCGFMDRASLSEYCIDINNLSYQILVSKFNELISNYANYKRVLAEEAPIFKRESSRTTDLMVQILNQIEG